MANAEFDAIQGGIMYPPVDVETWLALHPALKEAMPLCECDNGRGYSTKRRVGIECLTCGADAWIRPEKNEFFTTTIKYMVPQ